MPSLLHKNLRKLIGQHYRYLSAEWVLIEILTGEDRIVLQRTDPGNTTQIQTDQYGHARRQAPETLALPISSEKDPDTYSDELMLLFRGRI